MAVRKPYGLKKLVSEKVLGLLFLSQLLSWLYLSMKDENQSPKKGIIQDISTPLLSVTHICGTLESAIASMAERMMGVSTTDPSIASTISAQIFLTNPIIL